MSITAGSALGILAMASFSIAGRIYDDFYVSDAGVSALMYWIVASLFSAMAGSILDYVHFATEVAEANKSVQ
jgi:Flp pilus assembly protein TadG